MQTVRQNRGVAGRGRDHFDAGVGQDLDDVGDLAKGQRHVRPNRPIREISHPLQIFTALRRGRLEMPKAPAFDTAAATVAPAM